VLGIGKRERGKQYPLTDRIIRDVPLLDVDGDSEREGKKTYQQRPVYQQDVFTVSLDLLATSALLTLLFRGDSVILDVVSLFVTFAELYTSSPTKSGIVVYACTILYTLPRCSMRKIRLY
jgi:hypothetical protein